VSIELKVNDIKRGKPLWKFNNSLLPDKEYAKLVKDMILKVKQQYSLPQEGEMSSLETPIMQAIRLMISCFLK